MSATLRAAVACAWLATTTAVSAVGRPGTEPTPSPPGAITVPPTDTLVLAAPARGAQIYRCSATKGDPTRFEWILTAPDAELLDGNGNRIGRHYQGPTWESSDGSSVVGELVARADSPDRAIPWLLVEAKRHRGDGVLSKVTTITRTETAGGLAPATGCDRASAGKEVRVPYTATYRFYATAP